MTAHVEAMRLTCDHQRTPEGWATCNRSIVGYQSPSMIRYMAADFGWSSVKTPEGWTDLCRNHTTKETP